MKVSIIGKLQSKFKAPFDDPSWEIWGCNNHYDMINIPRYTLWFDIHKDHRGYNPSIDRSKLITIEDFPMQEAINLRRGYYFTNSMDYMIAYAILQGVTDISFYGAKLIGTQEEKRTNQLHCTREWIAFAQGKGINVTSIEPELLKPYSFYE
jgi:hypothetical protein